MKGTLVICLVMLPALAWAESAQVVEWDDSPDVVDTDTAEPGNTGQVVEEGVITMGDLSLPVGTTPEPPPAQPLSTVGSADDSDGGCRVGQPQSTAGWLVLALPAILLGLRWRWEWN